MPECLDILQQQNTCTHTQNKNKQNVLVCMQTNISVKRISMLSTENVFVLNYTCRKSSNVPLIIIAIELNRTQGHEQYTHTHMIIVYMKCVFNTLFTFDFPFPMPLYFIALQTTL